MGNFFLYCLRVATVKRSAIFFSIPCCISLALTYRDGQLNRVSMEMENSIN